MELGDIKRLYQEGMSSVELGKLYGCSHYKVLQMLAQANVPKRRGCWGRKRDAEEIEYASYLRSPEGREDLCQLRREGHSIYSLAILAAVRKKTVRDWLDEEGVE